jgi:tyrosine-protein kinase Etk/Wzc
MSPTSAMPPSRSVRTWEKEINIFGYVSVLMRRWKTIAFITCAILTIVAFNTFRMKPIYEASSIIHIKENQSNIIQTNQNFWYDPIITINTEIDIMKSRSMAEQVVQQLHLNWQVSKKSDGLTFKILEFTSTAKKPVYQIKMTAKDTFSVKDENGELVGNGQTGVIMKKNGFSLLINDLNGKIGDSFNLNLVPLVDAALALKGGFNAAIYGKQTNLIRTSYTSTDPVLARDMANAFVQAYIEHTIILKTEETNRTVSFIDEQIKKLSKDLNISEENLQSYKSKTGTVKLDDEALSLINRITEIEKSRTDIALQKQQLECARDTLKKAVKTGVIYSPGIMKNDSLAGGLAAKLSELEMQKKALLTQYTEAHQAVKALQNQIEEVRNKLLAIYEMSLNDLAKEEQGFSKQLSVYEGQMRKLPDVERNLAQLTRVSKVGADSYTFLLQKHEEARLARAATISNIDIIDRAITPTTPIKPNKQKDLLVGLFIGLALGIFIAFFMEFLDDTIKNGDEAKQSTGLPILAVIPHIASFKSKQDGSAPTKGNLIIRNEPKSVAAEAFRSLRTNLHYTAINKEKKIMLFTSTFPNEGKSTVTSNIAVVISQTVARVLLIDCDLRRSSIHEKFEYGKTPGLSEILAGDVTFEKAKHTTDIHGLDIITAGTTPPDPSDLLGSVAMQQLLTAQRENYDYIIIDAPPVLAVSDAPVLATISDVVILVMEAGRVPIKAAQHMRDTLVNLQATIGGIVINDKTGKGELYGYYGGRYYRYGRGYGYEYGYGSGSGYYYDKEQKPHRKIHRWEKHIKFIPEKWRRKLEKYLPR